ncbi:MAG: hypothetical protein K0Q51_1099 [Rickettsiaceae bacterium]|jgi:hypothetical protein|nr:hypothetical protein [Rickettsiaceae bacterium]
MIKSLKSFILLTTFIYISACQLAYWSQKIDNNTVEDSWITLRDSYLHQLKEPIKKHFFLERIKEAYFKDFSSEEFLKLNIENHRLERFFNAASAEEAYPEHDRPLGQADLDSVKYFMSARHISPIIVCIAEDKHGNVRYIKLDGVHRLMAAHILKKPIRVAFVDLR